MAVPVVLVTSRGFPITNTTDGVPATPVSDSGWPVVLVDGGGFPMALVNEDNTAWSAGGAETTRIQEDGITRIQEDGVTRIQEA